jgi:hypothetical protein
MFPVDGAVQPTGNHKRFLIGTMLSHESTALKVAAINERWHKVPKKGLGTFKIPSPNF